MAKLVVKKGQLYNERGEKQKLEFGNPNQLKVIKEYANLNNALLNEGIELDVEYTVTASVILKCTCGKNIHIEEEVEEKNYLEEFDNLIKKCDDCYTEYQLSLNGVGDLVAKKVKSHD